MNECFCFYVCSWLLALTATATKQKLEFTHLSPAIKKKGAGYECPLIAAVMAAVSIPVIASSGAGSASHFPAVFAATDVQAALAAGMFHRKEVSIAEVKAAMQEGGLPTRIV